MSPYTFDRAVNATNGFVYLPITCKSPIIGNDIGPGSGSSLPLCPPTKMLLLEILPPCFGKLIPLLYHVFVNKASSSEHINNVTAAQNTSVTTNMFLLAVSRPEWSVKWDSNLESPWLWSTPSLPPAYLLPTLNPSTDQSQWLPMSHQWQRLFIFLDFYHSAWVSLSVTCQIQNTTEGGSYPFFFFLFFYYLFFLLTVPSSVVIVVDLSIFRTHARAHTRTKVTKTASPTT